MAKKYLSNKELYKEVVWCKATGKMSPELLKMLLLICKKIQPLIRYNKLVDYEDGHQEAIERCISYWWMFDDEVSDNAFAYFTELIKNAYIQYENTLNHRHYKTNKTYVEYRDFDKINFV